MIFREILVNPESTRETDRGSPYKIKTENQQRYCWGLLGCFVGLIERVKNNFDFC